MPGTRRCVTIQAPIPAAASSSTGHAMRRSRSSSDAAPTSSSTRPRYASRASGVAPCVTGSTSRAAAWIQRQACTSRHPCRRDASSRSGAKQARSTHASAIDNPTIERSDSVPRESCADTPSTVCTDHQSEHVDCRRHGRRACLRCPRCVGHAGLAPSRPAAAAAAGTPTIRPRFALGTRSFSLWCSSWRSPGRGRQTTKNWNANRLGHARAASPLIASSTRPHRPGHHRMERHRTAAHVLDHVARLPDRPRAAPGA